MKRDTALALLGGIGLGSGLALLLDPASGRRRRALVRDQLVHASHGVKSFVDHRRNDLENRAEGTIASLRSRFRSEPVSDEVLLERVRANVGHVLKRVDRVHVSVKDGAVELDGVLAPHEAPRVLARIWSVPGVIDVQNRLELRADDPLAESSSPVAEAIEESTDEYGTTALKAAGYALLGLAGAGAAWFAVTNRDAIRHLAVAQARAAEKRLVKEAKRARPLARQVGKQGKRALSLLHRVA